jgi:putative ABC transport system substrate-binding protein
MKKTIVLVAVAILMLASIHLAEAQQSEQKFRVSYLSAGVAVARKPYLDAFRLGMRDFGFVEGQNLILKTRFAEGKFDRLPALAQELAQLKPDVILASTSPAVLAANKVMPSIPIVMVAVADPVGIGIVASLARPGGNITGITNINADLAGKRLELLKEILPRLSRVGVLINPDINTSSQMRNAEEAARALKLTLEPVAAIRSGDDLRGAFDAVIKGRAKAAIRMVDPLISALRKETADLAVKHRLPIIFPFREDVEAGGLVSYGTDLATQYRQTARFVNKILKGAKPAELPVEQPTKFELVINLKTAKQIGLTIPPTVLYQADKIIK